MSTLSIAQRPRHAVRHRARFGLLLGASALSLMLGAGAARAADGAADAPATATAKAPAAGDDLEEIIVSGYRHALEDAIATKREAAQIVEVVSAEDIAKLPDNSIAESLARLPGLAAQRVNGRAQVISLRGLGPDFTLTTLNGREQVSTSNNRSVEFDLYPSEIISSAEVYKTPQAGFTAQGLAGTVDLKTVRPLDYGKQVLAASARAEISSIGKLNPDSEDKGYRASATYIDQFAHDSVGVALSLTHLSSPTQQETSRVWGYPNSSLAGGNLLIGGDEVRANSEEFNRTGLAATVQYKPNDHFTSSLDFFYTHYQDSQVQRGLEMPLAWGAGSALGAQPAVGLLPGYTVQNGVVMGGAFTGIKPVGRSDINATQSDLYSVGWNGQYTKEDWTGTVDFGYSQADRRTQRFESYFGTGLDGAGATDTIGFKNVGTSQSGYQFTHLINYADPSVIVLTDPNNWNGGTTPYNQNGYLNTPNVHDDLKTIRGDVKKDFHTSWLKDVDVGFNYTDREKSYDQPEWYVTLTQNLSAPVNPLLGVKGASLPIPNGALLGSTDLSWIGLGRVVAYNPVDLLSKGVYSLVPCAQYRANCTNDSQYTVSEKVTTGFAKADIDSNLGAGYRVTGNFGLQIVHTDQSSTGSAITKADQYQLRTLGTAYTDLLPSMNMTLSLPNRITRSAWAPRAR